jgi:hypothetical protein
MLIKFTSIFTFSRPLSKNSLNPRLIKLMIEFNIGVSIDKVYEVKKIDSDFFPEE